jgi:hypothetical protein
MSRRQKVSLAPMAVASDGTVLLNIALASDDGDPRKLVEAALAGAGSCSSAWASRRESPRTTWQPAPSACLSPWTRGRIAEDAAQCHQRGS